MLLLLLLVGGVEAVLLVLLYFWRGLTLQLGVTLTLMVVADVVRGVG